MSSHKWQKTKNLYVMWGSYNGQNYVEFHV
jgi:hypothetical protein